MKNKFTIVTHATLSEKEDIAGPAHTIASYLEKRKAEYIFIRFSLFGPGKALISYFNNSKIKDFKVDLNGVLSEILIRLWEGIATIRITSSLLTNNKSIYIGIDPLNSLWGLILKKIGKVKLLITFTVDYSQNRYSNSILNYVYHYIDNLTIRNSDYIWSVSNRILDLRRKQGLSKDKLFYVPNSPFFSQIKSLINKNPDPKKLITIATISKAVDFNIIIDAVDELRKKFTVTLTIIGVGEGLGDLQREIKKRKLTKNIFFVGPKSHEEVFKILSEHGIGIALYTDEASWSFYSDSMKARDYLALGLPVIISGDIGTAHEIKKANAGILINRNKKELIDAIRKLIENKNLYNMLRQNALKLAKKNDIEKILDNAFKNL